MTDQATSARPTVGVAKEDVEGSCPECGASGVLRSYAALSEGGWFNVVKCSRCLHSVSREPGNRLGTVVRLEDNL